MARNERLMDAAWRCKRIGRQGAAQRLAFMAHTGCTHDQAPKRRGRYA